MTITWVLTLTAGLAGLGTGIWLERLHATSLRYGQHSTASAATTVPDTIKQAQTETQFCPCIFHYQEASRILPGEVTEPLLALAQAHNAQHR